jgi:hypothetical protein
MTATIDYPNIAWGLEKYLTSGEQLLDNVRQQARRWLQTRLGSFQLGSIAENNPGPLAIMLRHAGGDPQYYIRTEADCATRRLQIDLVATDGNMIQQAAEALRIAISGFCSLDRQGATWGGLIVRTCILESDWISIPVAPDDGSEVWTHRLVSTWKIVYQQTVPAAGPTKLFTGD